MEITANQQTYTVSESCSVQELLDNFLRLPARGIAIAVNQQIISKGDWSVYQLQSGDTITLISATQGG